MWLIEIPFLVWLLVGGLFGYFLRPKVLIVLTELFLSLAALFFVQFTNMEGLGALVPLVYGAILAKVVTSMWLVSAIVNRDRWLPGARKRLKKVLRETASE